jgi:hypothetical protein
VVVWSRPVAVVAAAALPASLGGSTYTLLYSANDCSGSKYAPLTWQGGRPVVSP